MIPHGSKVSSLAVDLNLAEETSQIVLHSCKKFQVLLKVFKSKVVKYCFKVFKYCFKVFKSSQIAAKRPTGNKTANQRKFAQMKVKVEVNLEPATQKRETRY